MNISSYSPKHHAINQSLYQKQCILQYQTAYFKYVVQDNVKHIMMSSSLFWFLSTNNN